MSENNNLDSKFIGKSYDQIRMKAKDQHEKFAHSELKKTASSLDIQRHNICYCVCVLTAWTFMRKSEIQKKMKLWFGHLEQSYKHLWDVFLTSHKKQISRKIHVAHSCMFFQQSIDLIMNSLKDIKISYLPHLNFLLDFSIWNNIATSKNAFKLS